MGGAQVERWLWVETGALRYRVPACLQAPTEQKKQIFEIVKDEVGDQVKLIAQVGSLNIEEASDLAKFVTDLGYDAISAVTPFYYKFDFEEIKDYYNTILEGVDTQLIIYSIPALTGVNMNLEQFG